MSYRPLFRRFSPVLFSIVITSLGEVRDGLSLVYATGGPGVIIILCGFVVAYTTRRFMLCLT